MNKGIDFSFRFGPQPAAREPDAAPAAARIGILGDFSGSAACSRPAEYRERRWLRVDIETLDRVLLAVGPAVELPRGAAGEEPETLGISAMDEFRPEGLLGRVPRLRRLLDLRARLQAPATFAQAAAELGCPAPESPGPGQAASPATGRALLAALLGQGASPAATPPPPAPGRAQRVERAVDSLLREAVGSSAAPASGPDLPACLAHVDLLLAEALRATLHHPPFQAVESLWRGLDFVLRRLPEEAAVECWLLDLSQEDLAAALTPGDENRLLDSLFRAPAGPGPDDGAWRLLAGCYSFGATMQDLGTLAAMGRLAAALGCPWVAAARPDILGCATPADLASPERWSPAPDEWAAAWERLRESPESARLVLACPRFLGRLPYGPGTDPVEGLDFAEIPDPADHERFLWTNPAFLAALAWAQARAAGDPWDGQSSAEAVLDDLPVAVFRGDLDTHVVPGAECWLPDRAVEAIAERGLSPVQPVRGETSLRIRLRPLRR